MNGSEEQQHSEGSPEVRGGTSASESSLRQRRVRIRLRRSRIVEGDIHIAPERSLVDFLLVRKHFLNLTSVRWMGDATWEEDEMQHLAIRMSQILWVEPVDPDLRLSASALPSFEARPVEIHLEGDIPLHLSLHLADEHRMSDFLDATSDFIPFRRAKILDAERVVPALAINRAAIMTIREL